MRKLLPLALGAAILVLSHLPKSALPTFGLHYRVKHALAYGALAAVCLLATAGCRTAVRVLATLGIIMAVGAVDELTQPWFGRRCGVSDWLCDLAGAGAVLAIWLLFRASTPADEGQNATRS